jgi:hypothetical protein
MSNTRKLIVPQGYDTITTAPLVFSPARPGMELVNLRELGILSGARGGAPVHGTNVASDIVTQLADGTDLNDVWNSYVDLLNQVNGTRQALINFLTYDVGTPTELVAQPGDGVDFEDATEQGLPTGSRVQPNYFQLGYGFKWYDLGSRYSWQYLADATQAMADGVANAAVEAFYRKQMVELLKAVYSNTNATANIKGNAYTVYRFYNADGTVPPTYKTNTFLSSHTHYVQSGAATVDAGDLTEIIDDFAAHGYTPELGYRIVIMVNKVEGDTIRGFRSTANGGSGRYDFIPSTGQPAQIMNVTTQIVGQNPPPSTLFGPAINGLNVIGVYGNAYIVQDDWHPAGYLFGFATGGTQSLNNPIGLRQHAQSSLRGLRLVKGKQPDYPLIDSYWVAGFGFGTRQRGAGYLIKIGTGGYSPPTQYS